MKRKVFSQGKTLLNMLISTKQMTKNPLCTKDICTLDQLAFIKKHCQTKVVLNSLSS